YGTPKNIPYGPPKAFQYGGYYAPAAVPAPSSLEPKRKKPFQGRELRIYKSKRRPDEFLVKCLEFIENNRPEHMANGITPNPGRIQHQKIFDFRTVSCGVWDFKNSELVFTPCSDDRKKGALIFGQRSLVLLLQPNEKDNETCRVDISYFNIDSITTGDDDNPTVTLTLKHAPQIYRMIGIADALRDLSINGPNGVLQSSALEAGKIRISAMSENHSSVAGNCFVYRLALTKYYEVSKVAELLSDNSRYPSVIAWPTPLNRQKHTYEEDYAALVDSIGNIARYGTLEWPLRFQIQRLADNGYMSPRKVMQILPHIAEIAKESGWIAAAEAVQLRKYLARKLPRKLPRKSTKSKRWRKSCATMQESTTAARLYTTSVGSMSMLS
ncbi:hypothetical protein LTS18_014476, partial [Coniosporium uncinatum]